MSNDDQTARTPQSDWFRRPATAFVWWCGPIIVGGGASFLTSSAHTDAIVWIAAFVWMGIGCALNARRCHRLHCYFSGPILLLGAIVVGLIGFGGIASGPHALNNAISTTLFLTLLSFLPEAIWGRYRFKGRQEG
jgi:hypothetical protein